MQKLFNDFHRYRETCNGHKCVKLTKEQVLMIHEALLSTGKVDLEEAETEYQKWNEAIDIVDLSNKEEYQELKDCKGSTIDEKLHCLKTYAKKKKTKVFTTFNGYPINSDMSLDCAYLLITGRTKEMYDLMS